ncbi:DUF4240 domain-containing protein [Streptomyces sp. NBC_00582]|uniref:DUF4240 domain-containing protein n=1 Tax=Streptomyces sp. NBC_00582 TaxID=2975783 RepID=UPI001062A6DD|nr:DUF4240 domain-containing protein [Streptomyces sp. NBC_00582]WUB67061.1 DUF4240 domain-containing protein [Streptomyces sp. NBC_00582]
MDDIRFWALIASFDWERAGDDQAVLAPASRVLQGLPPQEIVAFEDLLAAKLHALDTREHARWCYRGEVDPDNGDEYISADDFLYARCVVVANGKEFYEGVLADPSRFPSGMEFESLLYLAGDAYEAQTGMPHDQLTSVSWESFSNIDGWRPAQSTTGGRYTGPEMPPLNRRPA